MIARGNIAVVRLVPVVKRPFKVGILDGKLGEVSDFLAPLDESELALWEGGT